MKHTHWLLYVAFRDTRISRERCHAVFGLYQGCGGELYGELHAVHLLVVEGSLRIGQAQNDLVGLVEIPSQRLSILELRDCGFDEVHSKEAREEVR